MSKRISIYIAARFGRRSEVEEMYKLARERGWKVSKDWTLHTHAKPYGENPQLSKQYAVSDLQGTTSADVFVLLSDEAGTSMYVELGAAIQLNVLTGRPLVFVIGEHLSRSMFFFHPVVKRRAGIEQVFQEVDTLL